MQFCVHLRRVHRGGRFPCPKEIVDARGEIYCATAVRRLSHECGTYVALTWHERRTNVAQHKSLRALLISQRHAALSCRQNLRSRRNVSGFIVERIDDDLPLPHPTLRQDCPPSLVVNFSPTIHTYGTRMTNANIKSTPKSHSIFRFLHFRTRCFGKKNYICLSLGHYSLHDQQKNTTNNQ